MHQANDQDSSTINHDASFYQTKWQKKSNNVVVKKSIFNPRTALSYNKYNKDQQLGKPPVKTLNHCKI